MLWGVPEWQKVPAMPPVLPEMPVVVSTDFETSLVSRRPPKLFLGNLGHSVSELAPAGVVEVVAVLSTSVSELPGDTGAAGIPLVLPLATVATRRDQGGRKARVISRRVLNEAPSRAPGAGTSLASDSVPEPLVDVSGDSTEPATVASLIGQSAFVPAPPPLVRPDTSEPAVKPLTYAPVPPDMPLVYLPTERLRAGVWMRPALVESSGPDEDAPDETLGGQAATAGLVGDRSPVGHAATTEGPRAGMAPPLPAEGPEGQDLPLAVPPAEPGRSQAAAPVLGDAEPLAGPTRPLVSRREAEPSEPSPQPPVETSDTSLPLSPHHPPQARRFGLGEPMTALPPTATSWDITTLSRSQQLRVSRALAQAHRPTVVPRGAAQVGSTDALAGGQPRRLSRHDFPDMLFASTPAPRASLETLGLPSRGVTPPGLAPATSEEAPLLSLDSLFELVVRDDAPDGTPSLGEMRVRRTVSRRQGVDLTNVPVDRSPRGAAEADRLGARAFTSDRGVVIPPRAGSLSSGEGAALLAHELTHVAQRARHGPNLPPETLPAGQALEAEARFAEMTLAPAVERAALREPPLSDGRSATPPARQDGAEATDLPLATPPSPDHGDLAESILKQLSDLTTPAGGVAAIPLTTSWTSGLSPSAADPNVQRAPVETPATTPAPTATEPPPAWHPATAAHPTEHPFGQRPNEEELHNLSSWLYPMISHRIKGELREGRERAGMVTDTYRRW
jgi:hypothetical protein